MAVGEASLGRTLTDAARTDAAAGHDALRRNERRAWLVAAISVGVMAVELAAGAWLNSLALQSDGLHSGAHAGVLLIAAGAYVLVRRRGASPAASARTLNGAALVSGVLLSAAGVGLGVEAVQRLLAPEPVRFAQAAGITALGLAVSAVSAWLLRGAHDRAHDATEGGHTHGRDLNLWAAYLHMVADVITSVFALAALLLGAATGWTRLDAGVGFLNAAVVAAFSVRLLRAALAGWTRTG